MLAFGVLLLSGCSGERAPEVSPPSTQFTSLSADGRTLTGIAFAGSAETGLDVSGLTVDFGCVRENSFAGTDGPSRRISLLRLGCAEITAGSSSPEERTAQDSAKADQLGHWAPGFPVSALRWLGQNWDKALAVLGFPLVGWMLKILARRKRERRVHIVLVGHSAAGKTGLWVRWKNRTTPRHDLPPSTGAKETQVAPFLLGRFTILPKIIDAAGAEPWLMRDYLYSTPMRAKRVLIVVVAPCPLATPTTPDPVDADYVSRQAGYLNLPLSVLGGDNFGVRPHLVILFASKFDLLSATGPGDVTSTQAVKRYEQIFVDHRRLLSAQCKRGNIPFKWIIGSANSDWGTVEIRDAIESMVMAK
ncbi:hypothetical protein KUTG_08396 [Kutzneria sp. 744]|nr:hypothetical protein KUTG_08396 [Kutzneria sp. 744]